MKRILITVPSLQDQGGVASYYNAVLPNLIRWDLSVVALEIGSTHGSKYRMYHLTDQMKFKKALNNKISLVHVNPSLNFKSFIRDGLFVWHAIKKKIPVLVFFHGWDEGFALLVDNWLKWFFQATFGKADSFIVLASEFKMKLIEWGVTAPIYLGTTAVEEILLNGFDIENKLARLRKSESIKLLFLARLEREKGVFETVEAVRLLLEQGKDITLTIAGDGPVRRELEEFVAGLALPDNSIRFIGYVRGQDKTTAFMENDIYCFPSSYSEGLPTSVLEAMAFGMPVLTRSVGGLADIFEDGKMGSLVQGKTPDEIALSLEKMITNKDKMAQIAKYNYAFAQKNFMASGVADRLCDIYDKTIVADKKKG